MRVLVQAGRGRPRRYCSDRCRARAAQRRRRSRLSWEHARLEVQRAIVAENLRRINAGDWNLKRRYPEQREW